MLLASYFDYGTRGYPAKVARRLRATNITAGAVAATMVVFQFVSPGLPDRLTVATIVGNASIPLLHRFGPVAAPVALIALLWLHVTRVILEIGTGDGIYLAFLSAAPLSILLLGLERLWIAALLSIVSIALAAVLFITVPADTGIVTATETRINFVLNLTLNATVLFLVIAYVARIAARAEEAAERERERSDLLLLNILPEPVANRLRNAPGDLVADRYQEASVLFADIAGFTRHASQAEPEALVGFLNTVFRRFDAIVESHGLEKIKTLGDGYVVVSGVPVPRADHAEALAHAALSLRDAAGGLTDISGQPLAMRIGLATGPVIAGVIGSKKFFYDVWGDAVNMAARMQETGLPGRIHVTSEMARLLEGSFTLTARGAVEVKGKGSSETWFLVGPREAERRAVAETAIENPVDPV